MTRKTKPQPDIQVGNDANSTTAAAPDATPNTVISPQRTKMSRLRKQLEAPGGASLTTLVDLLGWQAHTVRAALSGLRKEGLVVIRRREGAETIYELVRTATGGGLVAREAAPVQEPDATDAAKRQADSGVIEVQASPAPDLLASEAVA